MCSACDFAYGVVRNALWDDAAESVSGKFAQVLAQHAEEEHYSSGVVGPYLAWRYSYLLVGFVFGLVQAVLSSPWLSDANYALFLEGQVGSAIPRDRFQPLVRALQGIDIAMWVLALLAVLGIFLSVCMARPSIATSRLRTGRRIVWVTWLVSFCLPFILFVAFPIRSMVDWKAMTADVCVGSISASGNMAGSQLADNLQMLRQAGALQDSIQGVIVDPFNWCLANGDNWYAVFYNESVPCVWFVEDRCRQMSCERLTPGSATERQCIHNCVKFTLETHGQHARTTLTQMMQECDAQAALRDKNINQVHFLWRKCSVANDFTL